MSQPLAGPSNQFISDATRRPGANPAGDGAMDFVAQLCHQLGRLRADPAKITVKRARHQHPDRLAISKASTP